MRLKVELQRRKREAPIRDTRQAKYLRSYIALLTVIDAEKQVILPDFAQKK